MPATRNVAVRFCPDVELLDFAGPFEIFSEASRWTEPPAAGRLPARTSFPHFSAHPVANFQKLPFFHAADLDIRQPHLVM